MISSLSGTVLAIDAGSAVIEVGGIGFLFAATPATLAKLHLGSEARVLTTLIVREDSLTLFGFHDADERDVFNVLLGVSGIGAKTALAALNTLPPDALRRALAAKDERAICKIPGIGPKVAKRLMLEIGDKLGAPLNSPVMSGAGTVSEVASSGEALAADVLAALVNLGWHEREAEPAVQQALAKLPDGSIAELLRLALQILGSRR